MQVILFSGQDFCIEKLGPSHGEIHINILEINIDYLHIIYK